MCVCWGKTSSSKRNPHAADLGYAQYTLRFLDWSEASALARAKSYKNPAYVSPISSSQFHTHKKPHSRLHTTTLFTMLFNKSILSFVAAIALASSVTAAATGQQGGNANNQVNQANQNQGNAKDTTNPAQTGTKATGAQTTGPPVCSSGTPTCCDSEQSFSSLSPAFQAALKALDSTLNPDLPVGINCDAAGTQTW